MVPSDPGLSGPGEFGVKYRDRALTIPGVNISECGELISWYYLAILRRVDPETAEYYTVETVGYWSVEAEERTPLDRILGAIGNALGWVWGGNTSTAGNIWDWVAQIRNKKDITESELESIKIYGDRFLGENTVDYDKIRFNVGELKEKSQGQYTPDPFSYTSGQVTLTEERMDLFNAGDPKGINTMVHELYHAKKNQESDTLGKHLKRRFWNDFHRILYRLSGRRIDIYDYRSYLPDIKTLDDLKYEEQKASLVGDFAGHVTFLEAYKQYITDDKVPPFMDGFRDEVLARHAADNFKEGSVLAGILKASGFDIEAVKNFWKLDPALKPAPEPGPQPGEPGFIGPRQPGVRYRDDELIIPGINITTLGGVTLISWYYLDIDQRIDPETGESYTVENIGYWSVLPEDYDGDPPLTEEGIDKTEEAGASGG